jgi:hypothetical protein
MALSTPNELARDRMIKFTYEELAQQWREMAAQLRELTSSDQ